MGTSKKTTDIFLVHSIKGGCGKTTVSLTLGAQLAAKYAKEGSKKSAIILDMDFKSTGMEMLVEKEATSRGYIDIKTDVGERKEMKLRTGRGLTLMPVPNVQKADFRWSDCFYDMDKVFNRSCITTVQITNPRSPESEDSVALDFRLDLAVASSSQISKEHFVGRETAMDATSVSIDLFRYEFKKILKWITGEGYDAVIIDLPPSFDEYTNCVYHEFFDIRNNHSSRIHLIYVTSLDITHLSATGEYLNSMLNDSKTRFRKPENTIVILNDITGGVFGVSSDSDTKGVRSLIPGAEVKDNAGDTTPTADAKEVNIKTAALPIIEAINNDTVDGVLFGIILKNRKIDEMVHSLFCEGKEHPFIPDLGFRVTGVSHDYIIDLETNCISNWYDGIS